MEPILYQWQLTRDNPFQIDEQLIPPGFENPRYDMHSAVHLGILRRGAMGNLTRRYDLFFTASWELHGRTRSPSGAELLLITVQPEALLDGIVDSRERVKNLLFLPSGNTPEPFRVAELQRRARAFCAAYRKRRKGPDPGCARQELWLDIVGLFHSAAVLTDLHSGGGARRKYPQLQPVFAALAELKHLPLPLAEAARMCCMSESYFAHLFRACTGISFGQYELAFRLNGAAAALQRGPVRLKQLAAEWGFYDASHFCRSYKRYFGVAPSRDRER
ncbi:MAG: helix-turn-helix transcriptional regulator [Lentisphaeria bacterium]|nr:helix-turn-helix transcriptional regulator [Lentisphaeria bacterium]